MGPVDRTAFGLVIVLWLAGLGAAGQFAKMSVIFPLLQEVYPGAGAGLGFLVSLLSLLGVVLGLVTGLIAARVGYRRMLLGGLVLGAGLSLWQATLPALPVMLASRFVEGVSHLAIVVAAPTLIAEVTLIRHRAAAMTLWSTFFGVAFAVVAWLGVPLALVHGPGSVFAVHGVYMAVMAAVLVWMLPKPIVPRVTGEHLNIASLLRQHQQVYRSPFVAAPAIGWLFYTLSFVSLVTVLPGFVPPEARAGVTGAMPLASIAVSLSIGVLLMRYFGAVRVIVTGFALALLGLVALAVLPGVLWPPVALLGALGLVQGASFAAVPQLNATAQARARANGAMAQMGNLGNSFGTPLVLLMISGFGYAGMIGFAAVCFSIGIVVHLLLMQARRKEHAEAYE